MFRHKKKDDDYLGPSKGLAKLFHRSMMFLLWPLRHPLWFVLVLFILFLAPTFRGVKPAEVHLWYWKHVTDAFSSVGTAVSDKTKEIMPDLSNVSMPSITVKSTADRAVPAPEVVEMPIQETRRKMFEKAKAAPVAIDIMQQNKGAPKQVRSQQPDNTRLTQQKTKMRRQRKNWLWFMFRNQSLSMVLLSWLMPMNCVSTKKASFCTEYMLIPIHKKDKRQKFSWIRQLPERPSTVVWKLIHIRVLQPPFALLTDLT